MTDIKILTLQNKRSMIYGKEDMELVNQDLLDPHKNHHRRYIEAIFLKIQPYIQLYIVLVGFHNLHIFEDILIKKFYLKKKKIVY
jgi:hypothetical protein